VAADKLVTYRSKRRAARTPEPVPPGAKPAQGADDTFVVQEHHARALHWDFRLERDGVLVSWAVPKGMPLDPATNHLAVHTEDHPLEYAAFEGEIPAGEYGGGRVTLWDRGTYECEKWRDDEVMVVLHGERVSGRYVLFRTSGDSWMLHRMDPPPHEDWTTLPDLLRPMLATPGELPPVAQDDAWAYEMKWDGVRAVVYVEGGRARALTRNDREVSRTYPELADLAASLGARQVVLDGELVAFDDEGRPSFGRLQQRMHVTGVAQVKQLVRRVPVTYLAFDLLHLDGRSLLTEPYDRRRELLVSLGLEGPRWLVPVAFSGRGNDALATSRRLGLEGVVAKRRAGRYEPGRRSRSWVKIKNLRTQEVVVGGWRPGKGGRGGRIGSLLLGVPDVDGLRYVGRVGTGFTAAMLDEIEKRLRRNLRRTSPFAGAVPPTDARDAVWVTPKHVGEVAFTEWTGSGRLRHPVWRGWRDDKSAADVVRED
jgi:bifunctional non-homologous end joining protein LigD